MAAPRTPKVIPNEVLANAIIRMSKAMDELAKSGLNEEAIVILIAARSRIAKPVVLKVLQTMRKMKDDYTHA